MGRMSEFNIGRIEHYANSEHVTDSLLVEDIRNLEQLVENLRTARGLGMRDTERADKRAYMDISFVFVCGSENDREYEFRPSELERAQEFLESFYERFMGVGSGI
jgi:hypothetical protein